MTPEAELARSEVLAAVEAAFNGVRLEDGVSLHEADAMDNYASANERAAAREIDAASDWRDISPTELARMYWVWSFFDSKGFRFHLPAAISWSMQAIADSATDLTSVERVIWALCPQGDPKLDSTFADRVALLSDGQAAAVRQFLQWFADHSEEYGEEARQALEGYWNSRASI